jgi:hypothetical protein
MFTHPYLASELARERQRDMLAQADRQRQARQLSVLVRAFRRAERARRRMPRSLQRSRPAVLPS